MLACTEHAVTVSSRGAPVVVVGDDGTVVEVAPTYASAGFAYTNPHSDRFAIRGRGGYLVVDATDPAAADASESVAFDFVGAPTFARVDGTLATVTPDGLAS